MNEPAAKALAFLGGALVGFGVAYLSLEGRFRKEYDEKAKDLHQTYEFVKSLDKTAESDYQGPPDLRVIENVEVQEVSVVKDSIWNHETTPEDLASAESSYEKALKDLQGVVDLRIDRAISDYGVSYIEAEEYEDEDDGREKEQILVHMDEYNPLFLEHGQPIDDWQEKIGDSIIVDFYRLVPPGSEPVLYVRNHRTGVDYEVVRAEP